GDDRHNELPGVLRTRRDLERREGDRSGRDAGENSLLARETPGCRDRLIVRDANDLVVDRRVEDRRDEAGADALLFVRRRCAARQHRALVRLDGGDANARLLLAQIATGAGDGTARPDAGDEDVNLASRISPDLRTGRLVVDRRVGRVVELAHHDGAVPELGEELLRLRDRPLHPLRAFGEHDAAAQRAEHVPALDGHRLGHRENAAIAAGDGGVGNPDAGVAARRLDDDHARLERAAPDRVVDHRRPDAVLHRVERIVALVLYGDATGETRR